MVTKTCTRCKKEKSISEFYKRKSSKDGLDTWCKQCDLEGRNREKYLARKRSFYALHANDLREDRRKYYSQHKAEELKRAGEYYQKNQENLKAYSIIYFSSKRAKIYGANGIFSNEQFRELCAKYDWRCLACGKRKPLTVDHIIPLSEGGSNYISNIQPLCKSCNSSKGTKIIDYRNESMEVSL